MTTNMIIAARLKAKKGKEEEVAKELRQLIPHARQEAGTLTYIMHQGTEDPCEFLVYEKYRDKQAFDAHASAPYLKPFFRAVRDLIESPPQMTIYRELS